MPPGGASLAGAPSAHLNVSGRAPAVKPQGLDRRRHAAANAKPCVRMGLPIPRHRSSFISLTKPDDMYDPKKLQERIMRVLEENDGKCLDTADERREVAEALFDAIDWFLNDSNHDAVLR